MKKFLVILAACAALLSCSKENSSGSKATYLPMIVISYSQNSAIQQGLSMTLKVDGRTICTFNKAEDNLSEALSAGTSGTVTFECKCNDLTYTEATDLSLSLDVKAASYKGGAYGSHYPIVSDNFNAKALAADKVGEYLTKKAGLLSCTYKYVVDADGKVTVE